MLMHLLLAAALMTPWGEKIDETNAWREYPRPQMVRANWTNLNGWWDYAITTNSPNGLVGEVQKGRILVPFAFESPLSGVGRLIGPAERMIYRKTLTLDPKPGRRILLNFEAVDYSTQVFLNGEEVTDVPHEGGCLPFSVDLTPFAKKGDNALEVRVWDPTESQYGGRGKQSFRPSGCFYTRVSGIWQTVWLEEVPEAYIRDYKVISDVDHSTVTFEFDVEREQGSGNRDQIEVKVVGAVTTPAGESAGGTVVAVKIPDAELWSPENPKLYEFTAKYGKDEIRGYFAMRKFSKAEDRNGDLRFTLNNEFYFPLGTLDQGWWPDGLLTPPSEAAMEHDIRTLKDCGFNMMRKHIKVEPRRYYYHCDTMGIIVLQDLPCNGPDPHGYMKPSHVRDYGLQRLELKRMVDELKKVPSIVMWIPYNEGWTQPGEFLTHSTLDWVKAYDPTRLVNGPSGCNDWEGGHVLPGNWKWTNRVTTAHRPADVCEAADAVDMHLYRGDYPDGIHGHCQMFAVNDRRVSFLGEFGGLDQPVEGHLWKPASGSWGYGGIEDTKTREGLEKTYLAMMDDIADLASKGLGGSVYTQTTDVEAEINGLMTYDRKVLKFNPAVLKAAHEKIISEVK